MIAGLAVMLLALRAVPPPSPTPEATPTILPGPTFCMEWIRQSNEGYDRLTLFRDRTLVWKTSRHGHEEVKREPLPAAEVEYYCHFFERTEIWALPADLRTRLTSEFATESAVTLARSDGLRKTIRFDELSSHTAESASLVAALEGLRGIFLSPLSPASRYSAELLPPGTLLKRFDGAMFRVQRLVKETGFVEIIGVNEPYSQWVKIEELRYQFAPPDRAP
ncbi:MAG TPA: hypothetical protein VGK26_07185 [Thermoanaerobaculia bacterium]